MNVEDLDILLDIAEESAVLIRWEQGDLIILDVRGPLLTQECCNP